MDEPMTLTERLNNPQRRALKDTDLVILDTARTEADMVEAAHALQGESACRKALVNEIKRLSAALTEANEVCRSAHEIAKRDGADTNWETFRMCLKVALATQQAIMHPKSDDKN